MRSWFIDDQYLWITFVPKEVIFPGFQIFYVGGVVVVVVVESSKNDIRLQDY
jgi:hypothetical protein